MRLGGLEGPAGRAEGIYCRRSGEHESQAHFCHFHARSVEGGRSNEGAFPILAEVPGPWSGRVQYPHTRDAWEPSVIPSSSSLQLYWQRFWSPGFLHMCHRAGDSSRGALCLYLSGQWGADTLAHTNSHTRSLKHTHSKHLYKGRAPARLFLERLSGIANILENNKNSSVNNCPTLSFLAGAFSSICKVS